MKKKIRIDNERLVPEFTSWYQNKMLQEHIERYIFATQYIENKKVLDVACGTGYGAIIFAQNGAKKVIGIDNNFHTVKYAKKNYAHKNISYRFGSAEEVPLLNSSCDVVVSFETIEHLRNYNLFLEEVFRVLKKGGVLIISTPDTRASSSQENPYHIKEFSQPELERLLKKQYSEVKVYGQKPIHKSHVKIANTITKMLPQGYLRWFADSVFKYFLNNVEVKEIGDLKENQFFTYLLFVAYK